MKQEIKINGVGYFDSFFSAVDISTMANSLKKFVLEEHITEDSKPGEILNQFIGTIIRQIDLDEFKKLSPHLFTYPVHYEDILEVEQIPSSYNQLHYLQENIDSQLQIKPMTTQRREEKSMTSIENLKNLSILEVADKLGMEVKRTGTHTFSWKEHDSFTLNTRDNYFNWFARSIGGDVIKMVQVVQEELTGEKYTFKQARHFLENQEISVASDTIVSEKELFKYYLEPFETDLRESREYLHNIRGLSNETIDFFIGKEVLAQATKKSEDYFEPVIVFKSLDKHNEVIGASLQGIIENHSLYDRGRLKQIMRGSDGTSGMNVDIGVPNRLIFAESPIDLMSYYELHKDNLQDVRLVAMDGLKESTVSRHVAELLYEVGELNDEVEQAKKSSFLAETAKLSTFFKDGNHQDLITLAIDNDDAGHAFIEKLTAKKIDLTADLPSKMEGIEKMDWNDILKSQRKEKERSLANEQETPYNSEQNKKNETKLRDLSEQAQGAAPLPEVIESQPLKDLSPSQTESHSSLYFTIKNPQKSIYKQNYHPIKPEELNKLNHHTDIIQNAAQWYLDNLSDTTIHYFYLQDNKQYNINIDFKQYHFMHLTGLFPIKAEQTAIKTLHDFAEGRGEYDNILVSNKGATFQKIKVLPHLKSILETESFLFHQVDDIPKLNSLSMTQAIQSDAKNILLAFSYNNENIYPASLMKLSDEFRIQIKNSLYQNVILGIFQEKDGEIHKISINNNYIKDNGAQMLSILKENKRDVSQGAIQTTNTFENNTVKYDGVGMKEGTFLEKIERIRKENEDKKIAEAKKEELSIDTDGDGIPDAVERNQGTNPYSPDTDGDGKSDHEEISFGSNPIDSNHPQKEQVKSLSEIINMKNPKELYNVLKDGIKDYFESDTYKEYLTAMSKFHRYSPRNIELILKQNPKATLVASHTKWLDDFGRKVNEGEKPLQILAPVPIKKRDPITNQPILDKDGNVEIIKKYKTVPVFDISQTSGRELPKPVYELKGTFKDYAMLYKSMKEVSEKNGVPIRFEDIGTGSGGYYSRQNNEIVIQTGMSEKQTLKTIIHEMAHSELHSIEKILDNPLSRSERELQAESVAFVVSNHYGIDTSEYTFGYLASWTEDKEGLKDLEEQMNVIQEESEILIAKIDSVLEKNKTKGITKNAFEEKINRLKSEKVIQSEERSQSPKKELSSDKEANL